MTRKITKENDKENDKEKMRMMLTSVAMMTKFSSVPRAFATQRRIRRGQRQQLWWPLEYFKYLEYGIFGIFGLFGGLASLSYFSWEF